MATPRINPSAPTGRNLAPRDAERAARRLRKRRDAAAALTVLGVVIFASPMVSAFGSGESGGAVPLAVQYVFNFWAALIAGAFLLSRALPRAEKQVAETADDAGTPTLSSIASVAERARE